VGAHVYLFAANTTGYGGAGLAASSSNASVSLLSASETGTSDAVGAYVATGSNGGFSLTGDYTCTSGQQLYLYALGGNNGSGTNAASGLMAAIGSCPASGSSAITVTVNEVSTIAAAYAFAGFATDATHVSSSGTALAQVGIANAFANAANLANLLNGTALATTPAGNGNVPQTEINTLANILASCVNTSSSCSTLLGTATADGTATGTKPTDTATAAINIAHHPGVNVATLYGMASTAVFTPALTAVPNDWTVLLWFAGGSLYNVAALAVDGLGNIWIANNQSVTELSSTGNVLSGTNGYSGDYFEPMAIAIDGSGNAWVANLDWAVTELSGSGSLLSGPNGYVDAYDWTGNFVAIAIDASGDAWAGSILNGEVLIEISSTGSILTGPSGPGAYEGNCIAIDASGNVWATDTITNSVSKHGNSGINVYTGGGLVWPGCIAIDHSGNAWVPSQTSNSVVEFSSTGSVLSGTNGYTGGGLATPSGIAIDGAGNVWVTNVPQYNLGVSVAELSSSGTVLSGSNGYARNALNGPGSIAIDGTGNVWITDIQSVEELVGAGVPVVTPLAVGVKNNTLGTRP
jgi:hypothetical protein